MDASAGSHVDWTAMDDREDTQLTFSMPAPDASIVPETKCLRDNDLTKNALFMVSTEGPFSVPKLTLSGNNTETEMITLGDHSRFVAQRSCRSTRTPWCEVIAKTARGERVIVRKSVRGTWRCSGGQRKSAHASRKTAVRCGNRCVHRGSCGERPGIGACIVVQASRILVDEACIVVETSRILVYEACIVVEAARSEDHAS